MSPVRVQRSRAKGWRMPDGAVYVGRPTRWGNPWKVDDEMYVTFAGYLEGPSAGSYDPSDPRWYEKQHTERITPERAVAFYRSSLLSDVNDGDPYYDDLRSALAELGGRDLVCWCPLDQPCHADVLLELANGARVDADRHGAAIDNSGSMEP